MDSFGSVVRRKGKEKWDVIKWMDLLLHIYLEGLVPMSLERVSENREEIIMAIIITVPPTIYE